MEEKPALRDVGIEAGRGGCQRSGRAVISAGRRRSAFELTIRRTGLFHVLAIRLKVGKRARSEKRDMKRLRFESGFWWYRLPHGGENLVISGLMREVGYNATWLADRQGNLPGVLLFALSWALVRYWFFCVTQGVRS